MVDPPHAHDRSTGSPPPAFHDPGAPETDSAEPFDPRQWAVHGLLCTFFDHAGRDRTRRVQTIVDQVTGDTGRFTLSADSLSVRGTAARRVGRAFLLHLRSRRGALTGLATAASVLIGLMLLWSNGYGGHALAQDIRAFGFAPPLLIESVCLNPNDKAAIRDAEQAVTEAQVELQIALAIDDREEHDPWIPWTKLYRNLRSLGRWDEALAEMHQALAFAKEINTRRQRYTFYEMCLTDLGRTYQAIGDYETALTYHRQSLAAARDYQEWFYRTGRAPDHRPQALDLRLAVALAPRLWLLSMLTATQGDMQSAWTYHSQAGDLLTRFFEKECHYRSLDPAPGTSLVELCRLVMVDDDTDLESPVVKIREHLVYQTRLLRVARDLDAAEQTLALAATLPDYPFADESRLDFNEPMERLRIAIARGHFPAALLAANEAAQNTAPRHFEQHPDHPPIGVLPRAELHLLRGVVLDAVNPDDPRGMNSIESAIELVQKLGEALPEVRRAQFLRRFADWEDASERLARSKRIERRSRKPSTPNERNGG